MIDVTQTNVGWTIKLIDHVTIDDVIYLENEINSFIDWNKSDYLSLGDFTELKSMDEEAALLLNKFAGKLTKQLKRSVALFGDYESAKKNQDMTIQNNMFHVVKSIDATHEINVDQTIINWLLDGIEPKEL